MILIILSFHSLVWSDATGDDWSVVCNSSSGTVVSTTENRVTTSTCLRARMMNLGVRVPPQVQEIEEELPTIELNIRPPRAGGGQVQINVQQTEPEARPPGPTPVQGDSDTFNANNGTGGGLPSFGSGATNSSGGAQSTSPQGLVDIGGGRARIGDFIVSDTNDEDVSDDGPDVPNNNVTTINPFQTGTPPPPTTTDRKNGGSGDRGIASVPTAGAGVTDPFGSYGGSGGPGSSINPTGGPQGSDAAEIAKNMHRGYHAASGGGPNGRRRRGKRGPRRRLASGQTIGDRDRAAVPELDLANSNIRRAWLRGLASTGQLADKKTFLFHSMCKHYNSYEKNNNINYGKTKCPPPQ